MVTPVCPLRKSYNFNVKSRRLNCLYKIHRFVLTPVAKVRFLAPLIKIYHRSLIFIRVKNILQHRKTKHLASIFICFPHWSA